MAKKAKKAGAKEPATRRKPAVAQDLPGMEDRTIGSLEKMAEEYADYRDERIAIGQREVRLKADVMSEMKRLGKTRYHRNGITIEIVVEQESVKVSVKKPKEDVESDVGDVS